MGGGAGACGIEINVAAFRIHEIRIGAGSLYFVQSHGIYTNMLLNINEGGFV